MLIKCPECGRDVSDTAPNCPHCGYVIAAGQQPVSTSAPLRSASSGAKVKTPPAPVALAISVIASVIALASPRITVAMPLIIAAAAAVISIFRKERWWGASFAVLGVCLLMFFWAADLGTIASLAGKDVTYTVSGSAERADITYENADGGTSQEKTTLPWTQVVHSPSKTFLYVSAQNEGEYGDIKCEIRVGDEVVKTATSHGGYTIASCSQ